MLLLQNPQQIQSFQTQQIIPPQYDFNSSKEFINGFCKSTDKHQYLLDNISKPIVAPLTKIFYSISDYLTLNNIKLFFLYSSGGLNEHTIANPYYKEDLQNIILISLLSQNPLVCSSISQRIFDIAFNGITANQKDISELNNFLRIYFSNLFSISEDIKKLNLPVFFGRQESFFEIYNKTNPTYYKEEDPGSALYTKNREKFDHFFPGKGFISWSASQIENSIEELKKNNIIDPSMVVKLNKDFYNKFNEYLKDNFGIDLTNFNYSGFSANRELWSSILNDDTKRKQLIEFVEKLTKYGVSDSDIAKIKASINARRLDENTKLLFNFIGAAGSSFWLSILVDAVFIHQIQNQISDGPFTFSSDGIKLWKNYFEIYTSTIYNQDGTVNYDKIDNFLFKKNQINMDFVKDDLVLMEIARKRQAKKELSIEEMNYLVLEIKKSLFTFSIYSIASGEDFIENIPLISALRAFVIENPDKVLSFLGVSVVKGDSKNKNLKDNLNSLLNLVFPYGFFALDVSYPVLEVKKINNEYIFDQNSFSFYTFSNFVVEVGEKKDAQLSSMGFKTYSFHEKLPSRGAQAQNLVKVGYILPGNNKVQFNSLTVQEILSKGGRLVYFVEPQDLQKIKNLFFSEDAKYKNLADEIMQKQRRLSCVGNGNLFSYYSVEENNNNFKINSEYRKTSINPLDGKIYSFRTDTNEISFVTFSTMTSGGPEGSQKIQSETKKGNTVEKRAFTSKKMEPEINLVNEDTLTVTYVGQEPAILVFNPENELYNYPPSTPSLMENPEKYGYGLAIKGYIDSGNSFTKKLSVSGHNNVISRSTGTLRHTLGETSNLSASLSFPFNISEKYLNDLKSNTYSFLIFENNGKYYLNDLNQQIYLKDGSPLNKTFFENNKNPVGSLKLYIKNKDGGLLEIGEFSYYNDSNILDFKITNLSTEGKKFSLNSELKLQNNNSVEISSEVRVPIGSTYYFIPFFEPLLISLDDYFSKNGKIDLKFGEEPVYITVNKDVVYHDGQTYRHLFKLDGKKSKVLIKPEGVVLEPVIDKNTLQKGNITEFVRW